jgi:hypothetical protein
MADCFSVVGVRYESNETHTWCEFMRGHAAGPWSSHLLSLGLSSS